MPKEAIDPELLKIAPAIFMAMIDTADIVAERYKVSREYQDEYSLESQRRMAAAQQANKFKDEIVPMKTKMKVVNKETKAESIVDYVVNRDECNRPDTTLEGLAKLEPVKGPGQIHHRRQRQPALRRRRRRGADGSQGSREARPEPMGRFVAWAVAGCEPDEMGIGPVFAVPQLLEAPWPEGRRHRPVGAQRGLRQPVPLFAATQLGIDPEKYNVNGGSIAIGHPFGMTGARLHRPRPAGRPPPQGEVGRRDDVHRRRPGRRRPVRNL